MIVFFLFLLFAQQSFAISLNEAFTEALRKNEVVGQGQARIDQADARHSQMIGAVLPNIGFNASYLLQPQLSDSIAQAFFPNEQSTVSLGVTQPIFRGLREFSALSQQKLLRSAQEDSQRFTLLQLYQNVAQSFFSVLILERDLKNLTEQAEIYGKRVSELQARVGRGESSASEALTAQSAEISTRSDIQNISNQLAAERENFAFLTGLDATTSLTDPNLISAVKKSKLQALDSYLDGIESRPDVQEALKRFEAAEKEVSIARGGHLPSVDLMGNYYLKRPPGFLNEIKWDVQLKLTFPIFEGGATQARVREAASKQKDAELYFHRVKRQAAQEVRTLYQSLKNKIEQLDTLNRSLDIANRNSITLQKEYRRGLSRNIDVQLALADYRVAKRAVDQAHFSSQNEWIRLQAASSKLELPSIQE